MSRVNDQLDEAWERPELTTTVPAPSRALVEAPPSRGQQRSQLGASARANRIRRCLLASDVVALLCAYGLMLGINALDGRPIIDPENVAAFVVTVPLWLFLASIVGLYHLYGQRVDHTFVDELLPVFMVTTVWIWFLTGVDAGLDADETQLDGASACGRARPSDPPAQSADPAPRHGASVV